MTLSYSCTLAFLAIMDSLASQGWSMLLLHTGFHINSGYLGDSRLLQATLGYPLLLSPNGKGDLGPPVFHYDSMSSFFDVLDQVVSRSKTVHSNNGFQKNFKKVTNCNCQLQSYRSCRSESFSLSSRSCGSRTSFCFCEEVGNPSLLRGSYESHAL